MPSTAAIRLIAWGLLCLAGCATLLADEPRLPSSAAKAAPVPSAEQIAGWVRDLEADEFFTRETAMTKLLEAGAPALPALKPVLNSGSLELISRGLFIVRRVGLSADIDTQDQAGSLLAELARRKEIPALASRATAALEELSQQRSARALAELEALGAKMLRNPLHNVFVDESATGIEIGDAFRGGERDLRLLKWLTSVPRVVFSGKNATDEWVLRAAEMPHLQELHLYNAAITSAGLNPLAGHASLVCVGIYYTRVGDGILEPLAKLPLLDYIKLYGTQVTREGLEKFKAASGLSADYRSGAFVGISADHNAVRCVVSGVTSGSPAEKAGLQREDVIVRFGDTPVENFLALRELIAKRQLGEEVEIEVLRGTIDNLDNPILRPVAKKLTLVPWDLEQAVYNPRQ